MNPEATYHAADNSWGGILGGLLNTGVTLGTQLVTDKLAPKKAATQQTLTTPGAKPVATAAGFNWKPWAIGGGILAAVIAVGYFVLRKP